MWQVLWASRREVEVGKDDGAQTESSCTKNGPSGSWSKINRGDKRKLVERLGSSVLTDLYGQACLSSSRLPETTLVEHYLE